MTINELIDHLQSGNDVTISNTPFSFAGKAQVELDGKDIRYWLFGENGELLSVSPEDEEIIFFQAIDEDLEPDDEVILYQTQEFEFSYSDAGVAKDVEGDIDTEEDDRFSFADYEADDGERIRIVTNVNTGLIKAYNGTVVVEEDIIAVE